MTAICDIEYFIFAYITTEIMHHMPNDLERGERYHTTTLREGTLLVCIGAAAFDRAEKNKSSKTPFRETFPQ
jgi:hypothetical protein